MTVVMHLTESSNHRNHPLPSAIAHSSCGDKDKIECWSGAEVEVCQQLILSRLSGKCPIYPLSHELACGSRSLHDLLSSTILNAQSNSVLIVGDRGCGKSMVVEMVLKELTTTSSHSSHHPFTVVRLHGLVHTDDRLVMKEIMKSLPQIGVLPDDLGTSFADSFVQLFLQLSSRTLTTPLLFILEEFDLFASHHQQSLIYHLFDIVQSGRNTIAVVGITCRQDVVELLEKRVKSRFSHRLIRLTYPTTLSSWLQVIRDAVLLTGSLPLPPPLIHSFNRHAELALNHPTSMKMFQLLFDLDHSMNAVFRIMTPAIHQFSIQFPYLSPTTLQHLHILTQQDSIAALLGGLSTLELSLMVSIKLLLSKELSHFNFEMVYREYTDFQSFQLATYKKPVAFRSFDRLIAMEFIVPEVASVKASKNFRMYTLSIQTAHLVEAVMRRDELPYSIKKLGSR